jgi:hypothetical protein
MLPGLVPYGEFRMGGLGFGYYRAFGRGEARRLAGYGPRRWVSLAAHGAAALLTAGSVK